MPNESVIKPIYQKIAIDITNRILSGDLAIGDKLYGRSGIILHSFFKKERAALPFYRLAISLGSTNTNILAAYGLIQLRDYKPEEALEVFKKAKASTKQFLYHKTLTANIALCEWKLGDTKQATQTYEDLYYNNIIKLGYKNVLTKLDSIVNKY